uniref:Uncharacterized protein n=1 Tax=Anguilla anguilla TaxID=7936 RepID=A0A0E9V098_ANGAN
MCAYASGVYVRVTDSVSLLWPACGIFTVVCRDELLFQGNCS